MRSRLKVRTLMVWVLLAALTLVGLKEVYRSRDLSRIYQESIARRRAEEVRLAQAQVILSAKLGSQAAEIDRLEAENAALRKRVAELELRAGMSSDTAPQGR